MIKSITKDIIEGYRVTRFNAKKERDQRIVDIYSFIPRIKAIDQEIHDVGSEIVKSINLDPSEVEQKIQYLEMRIRDLKTEKAYLLTENSIPLSFLELEYQCSHCKDEGYLPNGKRCKCFSQKFINIAYDMSNIQDQLERENFSTFNLSVFSDDAIEKYSRSQKENMREILTIAEGFVHNFDQTKKGLLFSGPTGMGKTFLCNCIAKALLDKGHLVVYQTSFKLLEIIELYKFSKDKTKEMAESYELLFESDLLIIDDLGAELNNAFTNSQLFNIINSRAISNKKTIISTNLAASQLRDTYTDRIFSRIAGQFEFIKFYGPDLRWET